MTTNYLNLDDLTTVAKVRFQKDNKAELIQLLPLFVSLLATKTKNDIIENSKSGATSYCFVNFWKVALSNSDKKRISSNSSSFVATSSARKLTTKFLDEGEVVTHPVETYFHQVITKPPHFMPFLQDLSKTALDSGTKYPKEMKKGANLAYLFKVLFSTILHLTFDKKEVVFIAGIGGFERKFKIKSKHQAEETRGGILHFSPEFKI